MEFKFIYINCHCIQSVFLQFAESSLFLISRHCLQGVAVMNNFMLHFVNMLYFCDNLINNLILYKLLFNLMLQVIYEEHTRHFI
jgi:hypothetical protein